MSDNGDLYFEPEMIWEQLIEWVKKSFDKDDIYICNEGEYVKEYIEIKQMVFCRTGDIHFNNWDEYHELICTGKTPKQMQTVIKVLFKEQPMSNFICPTCGFNNIDCGRDGYKTDREIELEKKLEIAKEALEFYANKENCRSKML